MKQYANIVKISSNYSFIISETLIIKVFTLIVQEIDKLNLMLFEPFINQNPFCNINITKGVLINYYSPAMSSVSSVSLPLMRRVLRAFNKIL